MAALTPMMQQYMAIKEQYKDCILFYRLGDFYEMFYDDALTASRELEITLTGKNCGQEERAPMCGVPYHAVDVYLNKLVAKGYKVAICEQAEDPKQAKGIVKREVIRIVTPGTNLSQQALQLRHSLRNILHITILHKQTFLVKRIMNALCLQKLEKALHLRRQFWNGCQSHFAAHRLTVRITAKHSCKMTLTLQMMRPETPCLCKFRIAVCPFRMTMINTMTAA